MTVDLGLHLLRLLRPQVNGEAFPGDGPDGVGVVADDVADANLQSRLISSTLFGLASKRGNVEGQTREY